MSNQRLHDLFELGRMGGGDHGPVPGIPAFANALENPHRAGRVRTKHAPVPGLAVRDHLADASVLDGFGDEFAAQRLFIRVQPAQAFEVAGGADVHGIGQGRQARHWLIRGAGK